MVPACEQRMCGHQVDVAVIDFQLIFQNSNRQQLADQSPGNAVAIVGIVDEAFAIDDAVDNLSRIEADCG